MLKAGEVVHVVPFEGNSLHLGRSTANQVVLRDPGVSAHHAVIYREGDQIVVRDLGSTNGTYVNDELVRQPTVVRVGDRLRLGPDLVLALAEGALPSRPPLRLERLDAPIAWPIVRLPFSIPGLEDVELVGADPIWLARDGLEVEVVKLDLGFSIDGGRYVLTADPGGTAPTLRGSELGFPYRLSVSLAEGVAEVVALSGSGRCRVDTANRVALLYALGQRWLDDGPGPGRGWVDDESLAVAVWGRAHHDQGKNNLNVLLHRVRKAIEEASLDRWCIERRPGEMRLVVAEVTL